MKQALTRIRNRVFNGMMYLLPLFFVFILLEKLWMKMSALGKFISHYLHFEKLFGKLAIVFATLLLVLLLFYVFGWLASLHFFKKLNVWIESKLFDLIPGYSYYKFQLESGITQEMEKRIPVWVTTPYGKRPALLIEEKGESSTVFFPNMKETSVGDIAWVENDRIIKMDIDAKTFLNKLKMQGKGLPLD
ncbi:MAG: hypothetical protein R2802_04010 [Flavobacteriaceae bacterium]|nr:hypothetical protein [Mangrovimonas sp.]MCB0432038.1 hypothetical protein [Mangrovimonas sp.]MCB0470730.1 hypothetical protein [Flavobacteriaceae bacterium]